MAWFWRLVTLGLVVAWFIVVPAETLSRWEVLAIKFIIVATFTTLAKALDIERKVDELLEVVKETSNV